MPSSSSKDKSTTSTKFHSIVSFFEKKDSKQSSIPLNTFKKQSIEVFEGNASSTSTTIEDFNDSFNGNILTSTLIEDFNDSFNDDTTALTSFSSIIDNQNVINELERNIQPGRLTRNELKFHKIVGEGQFGQVWLASIVDPNHSIKTTTRTLSGNKLVAVKVMSKYKLENDIDNLINEVSILHEISNIHPCLAHMYDTIQDDDFVYIVQEFYAGGELFTLLHNSSNDTKGQKSMVSRNCKFYSACICDAIHFLHQRNIIFRDCKPENIMIHHITGYPILIDFGYAKHLTIDNPRCYSMVGTPKYVAPEVILGTSGYDYQTDLWAIGILIYEMLVGFNPMEGENGGLDELELYRCITDDDYVPVPSEVSTYEPNAANLIDQLLQRDPNDRLHSSDELLCHQWFDDINFLELRRQQIQAPWIPTHAIQIEQIADNRKTINKKLVEKVPVETINTQYFDNWDYLANDPETSIFQANLPKITPKQQEKFQLLKFFCVNEQ
jgi:serine/threonine protein kinase